MHKKIVSPRRSVRHVHVIIEAALHERLEQHAVKLGDFFGDRPNVSAAIRDLLRKALYAPTTEQP